MSGTVALALLCMTAPALAQEATRGESARTAPPAIDDWEPGQPIPPGYHEETHTRTGFVVAGALLFGLAYVASLSAAVIAVGSREGEYSSLAVPVAGPFIQAAQPGAQAGGLMVLDGVVQVTGLAMFVYGLAFPTHTLVAGAPPTPSRPPERSEPDRDRSRY